MNSNVGIYIRVSSDTQFLKGHSLEWQEHILKEYANNHNLNIVNIYKEKGISGDKIETRPELLRLLRDIKDKKVNNVLVYKIDRLGRKVEINSLICKILMENNCTLTTSDTGIVNLETAYGTLLYNILSTISQFEVNLLSERVKNGKKQRVRSGLYTNSYNVYGYDNYCDYSGKRVLKINEFEQNIIKQIYNDYLNAISMNEIAKKLNDNKIPTKRGGKWHQSTISQILKNKLYIGIVVYKGNTKNDYFENKGIHKAIIEEEIFYKVQKLIASKKKISKKSNSEYSYFANVLVTSEGNFSFYPKQTKRKDKNSIRYYCKNKNISFPSINHNELERLFAYKLKNIKLKYDDNIIKEILSNNDLEIILNLIKKIEKEQNNLFECYNNKIIDKHIFNDLLKKSSFKKSNLLKQQEELKSKVIYYNDNTKKDIYNLLNNNLMTNYNSLTKKDKKIFINLFVDKIIIDSKQNIYIKWKRQ